MILKEIKNRKLKAFAEMLKENGFDLLCMDYCLEMSKGTKSGLTHFNFTDGKGFGYVQLDRICGPCFSSEYPPASGKGSGSRHVDKKGNYDFHELSLENAKNCMSNQYKDIKHFKQVKQSRNPKGEILSFLITE